MADKGQRMIVQQHIKHYNFLKNMRSIGMSMNSIDSSVVGSGEALLNRSVFTWSDRAKPVLEGGEFQKYGQAIAAVNSTLTPPEVFVLEEEGN